MEYTPRKKKKVSDIIYQVTSNWYHYTTDKYIFMMETMSNQYEIDELPKGTLPITFRLIYQYQWKDTSIMAKLNHTQHQKSSFRWRQEYYTTINLIHNYQRVQLTLFLYLVTNQILVKPGKMYLVLKTTILVQSNPLYGLTLSPKNGIIGA